MQDTGSKRKVSCEKFHKHGKKKLQLEFLTVSVWPAVGQSEWSM